MADLKRRVRTRRKKAAGSVGRKERMKRGSWVARASEHSSSLEMRREKSTEDILNRRAKKREGRGLGKGRGDLKKS